jgi:hypothetical protein
MPGAKSGQKLKVMVYFKDSGYVLSKAAVFDLNKNILSKL